MTHKRARRPGSAKFGTTQEPTPTPLERTSAQAHAFSLRALNQRPLSVKQLQDKLTKAEFSPEQIAEAVRDMHAYRYLDDARLAQAVARDAARRGKGPAWVRQALGRRGIDVALLTDQDAEPDAPDALAQALTQLARRFSDRTKLNQPKEKARVLRFLAARGFSGKEAYAGLKTLMTSPVDLADGVYAEED